MNRDFAVMLFLIGGIILSLLIFINKRNIKKAFLAVLVAQLVTWSLGLIIYASNGFIEYPVRLFPKAADNSFLHGFIISPSIFAIYYVHYPKQTKLVWRRLYTLLLSGVLPFIEVIENKYTNLIHYKAWNGYYSWALSLVLFFIIRKYLDWFFKNTAKQGVSRNEA